MNVKEHYKAPGKSKKMIEENNSENTVMGLKIQWPRPNSQSNDVPTCFTCHKPDHIKALTAKVKTGIFQ